MNGWGAIDKLQKLNQLRNNVASSCKMLNFLCGISQLRVSLSKIDA